MPKKDIKTINLLVVLTQTYNNTSSVFAGNDYVSSLTFAEKESKMMMWELLGSDGFASVSFHCNC